MIKNFLNRFAHWLFLKTLDHSENAIKRAVLQAFVEAGLPREEFRGDFNLLKTGKLHQVYQRAAELLNVDGEFDTVDDVINWLKDS